MRTLILSAALAVVLAGSSLVAACSDDTPDSFSVSCIDTRDCPSGQYCFCGGICVTPTQCSGDGDCCDNEACQGGLCLPQNLCAGDAECSVERQCNHCYCTPPGCRTDEECDGGKICDGGLCLDAEEFPCNGACQEGSTVCAPIRNACLAIPEGCAGITCGSGETLIIEGLEDRLGPSCQNPPSCICSRAREVPPGWIGTDFSALHLGNAKFAVLAHDHRYGDLVYLEVSGGGVQSEATYLDGVPGLDAVASSEGRRSGVYEAGVNQGDTPSAALNGSMLGVASRDVDNGDLRWAQRLDDGRWQISIVDQSLDTGYHPSLVALDGGRWAIAYTALDADFSALRLAISAQSTPAGPSDWVVATIEEEWAETGAAPDDSASSPSNEDIPEGVGLFPSMVRLSGELFVAYYDGIAGDLRMARGDGTGAFALSTLDTGSTRSLIEGAGDVGFFLDLAVAPDGTLGVAYVDRISSEVWYGVVATDGSPEEPLQFRRPPELIATGRDALPPLLMGADIHLTFDGLSEPIIAFQDASNGNFILARSSEQGWLLSTLIRDQVAGFSPHVFPDVEGATWVVHGSLVDRGERDIVEQIQALRVP